jgi:hypothetical protein
MAIKGLRRLTSANESAVRDTNNAVLMEVLILTDLKMQRDDRQTRMQCRCLSRDHDQCSYRQAKARSDPNANELLEQP